MDTLDQQLLDLCEIHGLRSISLTAYNASHGKFVGVNVQTGTAVGSGLGDGMTFAEAFKAALLDLHTKQALSIPVGFAPLSVAA